MMAHLLPSLPAPFAEAALAQAAATVDDDLVTLENLLGAQPMAAALEGILRRWGPGDRRAAASLWTQGYFGRLLRPAVAYGLVHDIWFSMALKDVHVGLSDIATPARFVLRRVGADALESHVRSLIDDNVKPLIARVARITGTSERVHWSNASLSFCRAHAQVRNLWPPDAMPADAAARLRALEALMTADHPLFRLTQRVPDGAGGTRLQRKVCCIRFKLDGLKKCGGACPIETPTLHRQ